MTAAVVAPAAILAAVYYGAHEFAKNPTAANLNPNNALLNAAAQKSMASSLGASFMAGMMTPALAAALNTQSSAPAPGYGHPATRTTESRSFTREEIKTMVQIVAPKGGYALQDDKGGPPVSTMDLGPQ
jgi:hypothetical protein